MKLTHDFSALWRIAKDLGADKCPFSLQRTGNIPEIEVELLRGREVRLSELESISGLLAFEGRQILLYIPDQGKDIEMVLAGQLDEGKKFHIAHCETLEKMKRGGRFERYMATIDVSGQFKLTGVTSYGSAKTGVGRLYVCQNCLKMLNYQQCRILRSPRQVRENFALHEFFETYSSCFRYLPKRTRLDTEEYSYVSNWSDISHEHRASARWRCSECAINLTEHRQLLHVHHRDGVKGNNNSSNLQVLCKACHRLQPLHEHLYIPLDEMKLINQLRASEGFFDGNWSKVLKYADPACQGVLGLARNAGWPVPSIEYTINPDYPALEVAWPNEKLAISLEPGAPGYDGWRVLDIAGAAEFNFKG